MGSYNASLLSPVSIWVGTTMDKPQYPTKIFVIISVIRRRHDDEIIREIVRN